MKPYPLLFHPIFKPRVWGGRSLAALGKNLPEGVAIGESWELADLQESVEAGRSVVANGDLAGVTLHDAIAMHRDQIMGDARLSTEGGFPLLIKYLDAQQNLSVQVHPDEAFAAKHPEAHLKSEAWAIVNAKPGAVIYKGLHAGVTKQQLAEHIRSGEVVKDLVAVPAVIGDCHYLPSGLCHALGAGVVVAEIQTPSDTTFRIYDWGRTNPKRELHIEQALQCIHFNEPDKPHKPHKAIEVDGIRTTVQVETDYFTIERVDALESTEIQIVTSGLPEVWMLIAGAGKIQSPSGTNADLRSGTTALVPAELQHAFAAFKQGSWLLRVKLPSPLKGLIA